MRRARKTRASPVCSRDGMTKQQTGKTALLGRRFGLVFVE